MSDYHFCKTFGCHREVSIRNATLYCRACECPTCFKGKKLIGYKYCRECKCRVKGCPEREYWSNCGLIPRKYCYPHLCKSCYKQGISHKYNLCSVCHERIINKK